MSDEMLLGILETEIATFLAMLLEGDALIDIRESESHIVELLDDEKYEFIMNRARELVSKTQKPAPMTVIDMSAVTAMADTFVNIPDCR